MNLPVIPQFSKNAAKEAQERQNNLTKPPGSLGRLEELSILLAGLTDNPRPKMERKAVIVMAADHGVAAEKVSAAPAEVTPQMVFNFLNGGAAINVLSRQAGARMRIVDIGVNFDFPVNPGLDQEKIAYGTANMAQGPAMTRDQAEKAIQVGRKICQSEIEKGLDIVAIGEMGIANTTAATAIISAATGCPPAEITGRGTGIDDASLAHKIHVIEKALEINQPNPKDGLDILTKVGGLEIGGMAGVIIEAAANRIPVVMDGVIAASAAVIARLIVPDLTDYIIPSHLSVETAHQAVFNFFNKAPLFDLQMRLGEGTGAAVAFHILEAACRTLNEMATFAEAGVNDIN
jgi:nicotinate-nucleotide--dimethylbenzimidazole phosphoribosyltransferase